MTISTRPESAHDEPFLRHLIVETLSEELMAAYWPEAIREHLLEIQYRARRDSIRADFPHGESLIVLAEGESAGWLFFANLPDEIRLVEIMILPEHRSKGIGSALIQELLAKAECARVPLRLSVDAMNERAIRLYRKLGFRRTGGDEIRHSMEFIPASQAAC